MLLPPGLAERITAALTAAEQFADPYIRAKELARQHGVDPDNTVTDSLTTAVLRAAQACADLEDSLVNNLAKLIERATVVLERRAETGQRQLTSTFSRLTDMAGEFDQALVALEVERRNLVILGQVHANTPRLSEPEVITHEHTVEDFSVDGPHMVTVEPTPVVLAAPGQPIHAFGEVQVITDPEEVAGILGEPEPVDNRHAQHATPQPGCPHGRCADA